MNGFFIAGTDTDAGKTIVTAALVRQLRRQGMDAVPMKVIQTGGGYTEDGYPISSDFEGLFQRVVPLSGIGMK